MSPLGSCCYTFFQRSRGYFHHASWCRLISASSEINVLALRKRGRGIRAIARELGIGNCTVQRIVSAA